MDRKTATVLFVLLFAYLENGVRGQCVKNPVNLAVLEGTKNFYMDCEPNPVQVIWECFPTSDELENAKINDEQGVIASDVRSLYTVDRRGLKVNEATIYEGTNKYSTSGICLGLSPNGTRLVGAKLIVVHDGPICTFNVTSPSSGVPVLLNCTFSYADHSVHPVRGIIKITIGADIYDEETIVAERVTQFLFIGYKAVEIIYDACLAITVELSFAAPTDIQYDFIATNKPVYSNSITIAATSTVCLKNVENVATLEGTANLIVGSSRNPQTLLRRISPTNDQLSTYPISNYDKGVLANMTQYFTETKTGLVILKVTALAGQNPLATAGIYTETTKSGNLVGFKVIVVSGPPTCVSNASGTPAAKAGDTVQLTCTAQYADHSLHQIPPRMTLRRNGQTTRTTSPAKTRTPDDSFKVTAVFTLAYEANSVDTCVFGFDPPPTNDQYGYIATNAPSFTATCNF